MGEELIARFPHIVQQIFENLDNKSLTNCKEVARPWQNYIEDRHMTWIRIVNIPTRLDMNSPLPNKHRGTQEYRTMTKMYLHLAVETGETLMFQKLIELEENKDKRTSTGTTLFHYACWYGQTKIANFLMERASDFNINLSVSDNFGRTAFHLACADGHTEIVQTLLEKSNEFNFDLNAKDKHG